MRAADGVDGAVRRDGRRNVESGALVTTGYRGGLRIGTRRPGKLAGKELPLTLIVAARNRVADDGGLPQERGVIHLCDGVVGADLNQPGIDDVMGVEAGADTAAGDANHVVVDIACAVGR